MAHIVRTQGEIGETLVDWHAVIESGQRTESNMHVEINTDHNLQGTEKLTNHVKTMLESMLRRFSNQITRVEVHLSDQNGNERGTDHKRCMMEARLEGRRPTVVTHDAASLSQAVDGAADKLKRLLVSSLGRLHDHRTHGSGSR